MAARRTPILAIVLLSYLMIVVDISIVIVVFELGTMRTTRYSCSPINRRPRS